MQEGWIDIMGYTYKVVGETVETFDTVEELLAKYEQIGTTQGGWLRKELQGQPKLDGLLGAMYDGMKDDKHVIRYETQKMYDVLSR